MRNPLTFSLELLGAFLVSLCLLNLSPQARLVLSQTSDNNLPSEVQSQAGETLPTNLSSPPSTESDSPGALVSGDLTTISSGRWLTDENIPWSTPVLVKDKERGDYIAVFDRDYSPGLFDRDYIRPGVISNWSRHRLQAYAYGIHQRGSYQTIGIPHLAIKIGDQTFELSGQNNQFEISEALRKALREAPPNKVSISYLRPQEGSRHNGTPFGGEVNCGQDLC